MDSTTLRVDSAEGISHAGLLSAARRLFSGCRYRPARQARMPVAVTVRHRVGFQTRNIVARLADSLTDSRPLVDGWAEPESIEVLESSNLTLREAAPRIAWRCHYAPGRSYGEPVRVLVTQRFVFRRGR